MILHAQVFEKSFGAERLYSGLDLKITAGKKIGLVGRNGCGKSTLLKIIDGTDTDFDGELDVKRGLTVVSSRQEHQAFEQTAVLDYVLGDLPEYAELSNAIETLPETMGSKGHLIQKYSDALERFGVLGYYDVKEEVSRMLDDYQISGELQAGPLGNLSGGQKRLVELVKVQRAHSDLALIDEPTNHMDYIAKERFVEWFKAQKGAVVVISHDRDVLKVVDSIVEIRDGRCYEYEGGYDEYLRSNTHKITSEMNEYKVIQSRIKNLKEDVVRFQRLKERARDPGTISRFKSQEQRARDELARLEAHEKPTFWIDKDSKQNLKSDAQDSYEEHKARTIRISSRSTETKSSRLLVKAEELSLNYDGSDAGIFTPLSFQLREREVLRLHGRNGAGKSTIVQHIMNVLEGSDGLPHKVGGATLELDGQLRIGRYEQEIETSILDKTLEEAIEEGLLAREVSRVSETMIRKLLGDYLFNPMSDGKKKMSVLSGGQKARFQLMMMFAVDPNLLILDEPTNHLDLPSIEELEEVLQRYHGAIIYISHDSYFADALGGSSIVVKSE